MELPLKRKCPQCEEALGAQKPAALPYGWYICSNGHKYHLNHLTGRQCEPENPTELFGDPFDPYENN